MSKQIEQRAIEFIQKAVKIHGDTYSYDKVVNSYINAVTPVTIICSVHGEFKQRPNDHSSGKGCKYCAGNVRKTNDEFIAEAVVAHGDLYDYSNTVYVNNKTKVKVICPTHGVFTITPNDHIGKQLCGCPKCGIEKRSKSRTCTTEEFIQKAKKVHNGTYEYSKVVYTNSTTPVKIICKAHGEFEQSPSEHLQGKGCRQCNPGGFDGNKEAILYYLKITSENGVGYKIGITNRTVAERYSREKAAIEVLKIWKYQSGTEAQAEETRIKRKYKEYVHSIPLLVDGNTELYSKDILEIGDE